MLCELCWPDDCKCPPCPCIWCRHKRGETSAEERRMIEARNAAFIRAEERDALRIHSRRTKSAIAQARQ